MNGSVINMNNKPEWFEIIDNDQPTSRKNRRRGSPIATFVIIAIAVAVGAVMAQPFSGAASAPVQSTSVIAVSPVNRTLIKPVVIAEIDTTNDQETTQLANQEIGGDAEESSSLLDDEGNDESEEQ